MVLLLLIQDLTTSVYRNSWSRVLLSSLSTLDVPKPPSGKRGKKKAAAIKDCPTAFSNLTTLILGGRVEVELLDPAIGKLQPLQKLVIEHLTARDYGSGSSSPHLGHFFKSLAKVHSKTLVELSLQLRPPLVMSTTIIPALSSFLSVATRLNSITLNNSAGNNATGKLIVQAILSATGLLASLTRLNLRSTLVDTQSLSDLLAANFEKIVEIDLSKSYMWGLVSAAQLLIV